MAVAPPRPKDLPLNALRAYEAAARLGSFVAAAQELGVTPGAITAHVKTLEAALGTPLFERSSRGVTLTPLGQRSVEALTGAFDALGEAVQDLRRDAAPQTVHIATLPSIAQLWLSPRLPGLRAAAPDIEISITAMEAPPNLKRAPYDLCLFHDDQRERWLREDAIFPVCAPSVAARLQSVADLASVPCLSDTSWAEDWRIWLESAAPGQGIVPRGPVFSLYALAVEETVNGAGVLMGHEALIGAHLERGQLVAPFSHRVLSGRGLSLWAARSLRPSGPAGQVARWLRAAEV